jgi:hypothetical protein
MKTKDKEILTAFIALLIIFTVLTYAAKYSNSDKKPTVWPNHSEIK